MGEMRRRDRRQEDEDTRRRGTRDLDEDEEDEEEDDEEDRDPDNRYGEDEDDAEMSKALVKAITNLSPRRMRAMLDALEAEPRRTTRRTRREDRYEDTPRTEVTSEDLFKAIDAAIRAGLQPLTAEVTELRKAVDDQADAIDEMAEKQEVIAKAVEALPETEKLVKALLEQDAAAARTTPERRTGGAPQTTAAELLDKAGIDAPDLGGNGEGLLSDTEAAEFGDLMTKATALQDEHSISVPGFLDAVVAAEAGDLQTTHLQTLRKGVEAVEKHIEANGHLSIA